MRGVVAAPYVMRADGSHIRRVTPAAKGAWLPDWAPDGSVLSVSHCCDTHPSRLWTIHPDGSGMTEIFSATQVNGSSFAPDGDRIAMQIIRGIWVANVGGSDGPLVPGNAHEPTRGPGTG